MSNYEALEAYAEQHRLIRELQWDRRFLLVLLTLSIATNGLMLFMALR